MRISRAVLAATVLAAGLGTVAGPAHATDYCNSGDPGDRDFGVTNIVRVGIDDPFAGITGVVVCVGLLGDAEYTTAGAGVVKEDSGDYTLYLCLPTCRAFP